MHAPSLVLACQAQVSPKRFLLVRRPDPAPNQAGLNAEGQHRI